jgi:hypothetical protein
MHFNTKYIFKGDTEKEITGKINYNFDQILSFAVGPDGHQGPIGPTGIYGPAGKRGSVGATGIRASSWYKQPTEPIQNLITNDIWVDTSVSDSDIKVFNYPVANNQWQDSGYSFFNSRYFQSYSYIEGPGGATDKNVIGFKYPDGITGSADTSLLINDSNSSNVGANPNNSKVLVSTSDQVDRPIMSFSKNGEVSNDVPSFYWNSLGSDAGLKFDSGGSLYVTSNLDFSIDSGLARTLIISDTCTFSGDNGGFNVSGDGDFHFNSNISVGVGGFLNVSSSNLSLGISSFIYKGSVTISSPLTSTYILDANPSSAAYNGGISALVKPGVVESFNFSDYTGNPVLSNRPSGSVTSGNFAQTIFGSTGGLTGGTGGPFSYHVKKVKEIRQDTTTLTAKNYLTPTSINLTNVFDISTNTNWDIENIIATPTKYDLGVTDKIASYKVGSIDANLNYKASTAALYGSGFSNGLVSYDVENAVVNDMCRLSDGSTIFVGTFRYYNGQPVRNGDPTRLFLGICKIRADGTLDEVFRTNISSITVVSAGTINGIILDEFVTGKIFIYGSFAYESGTSYRYPRYCIASFDLNGLIDTTFRDNAGQAFQGDANGNQVVNKAIISPSDNTIIAVGNFTSYITPSGITYRNKLIKIKYTTADRGKVLTTFLPNTNDGFRATAAIPVCLDLLPSGNIIIGGTFTGYTFNNILTNTTHIIEIKNDTGAVRASDIGNRLGSITAAPQNPIYRLDPIITAVKSITEPAGNRIYIGGNFLSINSSSYNRIAKLTTSATASTVGAFSTVPTYSVGTGFDDVIYDFIQDTSDGDRIYVGGRFTSYRGKSSPGFIRIKSDGNLDATILTDHTISGASKDIQRSYLYSLGLVRKMYLKDSLSGDEFLYVGGFLTSEFSANPSGGVYLKVPSSISSQNGYAPVYKDNTTTNYRIFLNDISNDTNPHYLRGIVFDTGLPAATTSYVNFSSTGITGCQYVDLMWTSKSSTANLSPRLFYKNCQGIGGYVDFGLTGVYSANGPITINTGQSVPVSWSFSGKTNRTTQNGVQGTFYINKNGTSFSTLILDAAGKSGSGNLSYSVGDRIYATVQADRGLDAATPDYAKLTISKTSISTGVEIVVFQGESTAGDANVNNWADPITVESGYSYDIIGIAQGDAFFYADNILNNIYLF